MGGEEAVEIEVENKDKGFNLVVELQRYFRDRGT